MSTDGRYLTFNTIFGNRIFWFLGGAVGTAGYLLFSIDASPYLSALTGSAIESLFGIFVYVNVQKAIIKNG